MISRNERRQLKRQLGVRVLQHPYVKRIQRNLKEAGDAATEVYRLDGDSPADHVYFDVYSMRKWALANVELVMTSLDWSRVHHLVESGAVDAERLFNHTIQHKMDPVIIGVSVCDNGSDLILDGTHRYVAYALQAASSGFEGLPLPLPAYFLEPSQWRRFVIPNFIANALEFDRAYPDYAPS